MKQLRIKISMAALLTAAACGVNAQSTLTDYGNGKVDLGMGVERSLLMSTAATETISGEELQKTAAVSLKDALYGRLLGLTALKGGGFVGRIWLWCQHERTRRANHHRKQPIDSGGRHRTFH